MTEPKPVIPDDKRLFPKLTQSQEESIQELAKIDPKLAEAIRQTAKEKLSEPERPRFEAHSAIKALEPQPPIDFIIDKLISRGSVNLFYGEAGSKKTYSLIYLAACCSVGKNFLNFTTKPSKVLIIDEESGNVRLLRRLGEVLRGAVIDDPGNIFYMSLSRLKLNNQSDVIDLMNFITVNQYDLIIIDSLSDVMDGDENSKEDVQPVFNNLRLIADQTNSAIFMIHHPNKMGGYRGSSAIKGSVDLMIEVVSQDGNEIVKFTSKKERDIEKISFTAKAIWEGDQFYLQTLDFDEEIETLSEAQQFVIETLKESGEMYIKEIKSKGDKDNFTMTAIGQAIKDLTKTGIIYRTNNGAKGTPAKYALRNK